MHFCVNNFTNFYENSKSNLLNKWHTFLMTIQSNICLIIAVIVCLYSQMLALIYNVYLLIFKRLATRKNVSSPLFSLLHFSEWVGCTVVNLHSKVSA